MAWLILAFIAPILVAWSMGSTYPFAYSVSGMGLLFCVLNIVLIHGVMKRRSPSGNGTGGKVPTWVSVLGLMGLGFLPSGLVIALLLWINVIANRGA